jgi:protein-tyrosine phosphatase
VSESDEGVVVRPKGYVHDEPVVRRVGDRALCIGNRAATESERVAERFAHVLSVNAEPGLATTHHRPLVDSEDATWERFAAAVDAARALHDREGALLVNCRAGVSRSTAVLAAALAAAEDRAFVDALHAVQDARPHAVPHPRLHDLGVAYVAAHE